MIPHRKYMFSMKKCILSPWPMIFLLMIGPSFLAAPKTPANVTPNAPHAGRDAEPVVVPGTQLPELVGRSVDDIGIFAWDESSQSFEPIPFQVDQRLSRTFYEGEAWEATQVIYNVEGLDDDLFDTLDEVVFIYERAGAQAPVDATWPASAETDRYEIQIVDPRPGVGEPPRWAYLFLGAGLARSSESYVSSDGLADSTYTTASYELKYEGPWLLTHYSVNAPCGSGLDLVDRFKGRAGLSVDRGETEDFWDDYSTYLGGIEGPVRAIRVVLGAASGFGSITDYVMSPTRWERSTTLRVHPMGQMWLYWDWLPDTSMSFYYPGGPGALALDGEGGVEVGPVFLDWTVTRGPAGGAVAVYDVPDSPFVGAKQTYFMDDENFDDDPKLATGGPYLDEDDSAWGNHGFTLINLSGTYSDDIYMEMNVFPLCGGEGDATYGPPYAELIEYPLAATASFQQPDLSRIETLVVERAEDEVILDWSPVPGALSYRVYESRVCSAPREEWVAISDTTETTYRDVIADPNPVNDCYSVVSVNAEGEEGLW